MNIWWTSDTHFGHANILKYDQRPFATIEEHDAELVRRWNTVVDPGDLVYHLGDFSWHNKTVDVDGLLEQLHGTKFLIQGNHDHTVVRKAKGWAKVTPYHEIKIGLQVICMFHYRMTIWNQAHRGAWALHGHSHGSLPEIFTAKTIDVGTMCWNYTPVSYNQIAVEMANRTFVPVDAHGKESYESQKVVSTIGEVERKLGEGT